MSKEQTTARKRVPVTQLRPGMFVVGLDRSWIETPFFFHRKLIESAADIERFKKHGIREVVIDTQRGADVASELEAASEQPGVELAPEPPAAASHELDQSRASTGNLAYLALVQELESARGIHAEALAVAQSIFDGARGGASVNCAAAKKVVGDLLGSVTRSPDANLLLVQMRRFDKGLFAHGVNVCVLSLIMSSVEQLDEDSRGLGIGALLHDIGETRIPRQLIRHAGRFDDAERRLVEQHPRLGAMLLDQSAEAPEIARRIVGEHHERIDGSGYPNRAAGDAVSLASQVVAIADMYDDMFSGRNQAMLQPVEVLRQFYIQSQAGVLDPKLVEGMIHSLGVYPVGSVVELNTGERGVVVAANRADTLRPAVRLITSRLGDYHGKGPILDLRDGASGSSDRHIVKALDPGRERIDPMFFFKIAPALVG